MRGFWRDGSERKHILRRNRPRVCYVLSHRIAESLKCTISAKLDSKELDFKELLGVLGYLLGVLGYLMGVPIEWAFPCNGRSDGDYSKETVRGDFPKETIRRSGARDMFGVAQTFWEWRT